MQNALILVAIVLASALTVVFWPIHTVPQDAISFLKSKHWAICFYLPYYGCPNTTIDYALRLITVYDSKDATLYHAIANAVVRETGWYHIYEHLYSIEGSKLSEYMSASADEFWASAYAMYFCKPRTLRWKAPITYEFISTCYTKGGVPIDAACNDYYRERCVGNAA